MRLIRFGQQGREKPGVLLDGKRRDLWATSGSEHDFLCRIWTGEGFSSPGNG